MVAEIIIENLVEIINWNLHANFNLTVDLTHYGNFPIKIVKDAIGDEIIMIDSSNSGIVLYGNAVTVVDCCSEKNWKDNFILMKKQLSSLNHILCNFEKKFLFLI